MFSKSRSILERYCLVIAACGLAATPAAGESLGDLRSEYGLIIDANQISVSGVSAGGWITNQFHIAHSTKIMGAGIIAAGPYQCASSPSFLCGWAWWLPYDSCQAFYICSHFAKKFMGMWGTYLGPPDAGHSVSATLNEAANGNVDPIVGLKGDRVWLFSGSMDSLAPQDVMDQLQAYYQMLYERPEVANPRDNIAYVKDKVVEHSIVIDDPDTENRCVAFGPPYINDCDYNSAGAMLSFLYSDSSPTESGSIGQSAIHEFDQTEFFDTNDASVSMNAAGHIYVPEGCRDASCRLHVAFHGCGQYQEAIQRDCENNSECPALYFFKDAGYNEWADNHNTIVLYPQATGWGESGDGTKNPFGCWDWWGYTGPDYSRKSGKQIRAVARMINVLVGDPAFLEVPEK